MGCKVKDEKKEVDGKVWNEKRTKKLFIYQKQKEKSQKRKAEKILYLLSKGIMEKLKKNLFYVFLF